MSNDPSLLLAVCVFTDARNNDEIVHISLQESYCRFILTYGVVAVTLTVHQYRTQLLLECCVPEAFRFNKWESVRTFIYGIGRLDLHQIVWLMPAQFYD
jgi:hypothetical protein